MVRMTRRRWVGAGIAAAAVAGGVGCGALRLRDAPIGYEIPPEALARARALLRRHPAVDAHAHPGRTFVHGAEHLAPLLWIYARLGHFEEDTVREMREGGLSAAVFAAVSDFQVLDTRGESLVARRDFAPGEAWASYQRQIGHLHALAGSGLVVPVRTAGDIAAARAAGKVGALWAVEGGDFLEGLPGRVATAAADGVCSVTLLHYRTNELGDIITGTPVHGGLTPAGKAVVRAMNEAGLLVDVAHASEATARGILDATRKPVMASHVHVHGPGYSHPRFISRDLARAVAASGGGVLGAWPAGFGITDLQGFVDRSFELVDAVGIDHVCLGTDMDANYKPVLGSYAMLPHFVAGLLLRGMHEPEVARLVGGNFLRVLAAQRS